MDTTTLVLIWDDVFNTLLEKITELTTSGQQELLPKLLEEVILLPLKKMSIEGVQFLYEQLQNPYINVFWHEFVDTMLIYVYVGLIFYFGIRIIVALIKRLYDVFIDSNKVKPVALMPIKQFFILQCLHFIIYPLMVKFLEIYPDFINEVSNIIIGVIDSNKHITISFIGLSTDYLLLEVICLLLLLILCLVVIFQFMQQGILLIFSFMQTYTSLVFSDDISIISLPLKTSLLRIILVFICQKLLLQNMLTTNKDIKNLPQLLQLVAMMGIITYLPFLFKSITKRIKEARHE